MKKPSKKTLTNKLDKRCSQIVRSRGVCDKCGSVEFEKLQCAHIYSRKFRSVRWDFDNLLCLCAGCHFVGHQKPLEFAEFVKKHLGQVKYAALKIRANNIRKWTQDEMQFYYDSLTHVPVEGG